MMHKKLLKYILSCLVMMISIVLILNVVMHYNFGARTGDKITVEELSSPAITSEYDNPIDLSFINENVGWAVVTAMPLILLKLLTEGKIG